MFLFNRNERFDRDVGGPRRRRRVNNPLLQFKGDVIAVHYSVDDVVRNAQGRITFFRNLGGAGAIFNAPVVGPALPQLGSTVVFPGDGSSYVQIDNPVDLAGVRLMWLMDSSAITHGMRVFGHGAPAPSRNIAVSRNASGMILQLNTAGQATVNLLPRVEWPGRLAVYELLIVPGLVELSIDGNVVASATHSHDEFLISRMGYGGNATGPFGGPIGEVFGLIQGTARTADAENVAREWLSTLRDKRPLATSDNQTFLTSWGQYFKPKDA